MLFNSFTFVVFFSVVFSLYWLMRRSHRAQNMLLLAASYVFYAWWDVRFLFLIVIATAVDYCCTLLIDRGRMTVVEQLKAAGLILFAAVFFVTPDWGGVRFGITHGLKFLNEGGSSFLPRTPGGHWMLAATVAGLLFFSAAVVFSRKLQEGARRKLFVVISIAVNLSILAFFKYCNFFVENLVAFSEGVFNYTPGFTTLKIVLPIGISFYTFKTISHTVDVYRGKIAATSSLVDVAAYVSFFPQLLAGPIDRATTLIPQLQKKRVLCSADISEGLWLILWGLYKKVVVADNLARIVNTAFEPFDSLSGVAGTHDGLQLLVVVYAFTFQIYCDFSGYTDMARGTARLLGFDTMLNFRLPYFAVSPSDFWRRWHISLSTWLRDYLYVPLGGNRNGTVKLYRNLMITMVLGGLWHGASWTFVLWGAYHGFILVAYRVLVPNIDREELGRAKSMLAMVVMFHLTAFGWLLFRAENVETIAAFSRAVVTNLQWSPAALEGLHQMVFYAWFLVLFQLVQARMRELNPVAGWHWFIRLNVILFIVMSVMSLATKTGQEFIYFAF